MSFLPSPHIPLNKQNNRKIKIQNLLPCPKRKHLKTINLKEYRIGRILKNGNSTIKLCQKSQKGNGLLCLKEERIDVYYHNEVSILKLLVSNLNYQQLVDYGVYEDKYYIVTRKISSLSWSLYDRYFISCDQFLDISVYKRIVKNMILNVKYLHDMNIVHRDLKSEHFLMDDNYNLTLIDFGMSIKLRNNCFNHKIQLRSGTEPFMAPEIDNADGDTILDDKLLKAADVWSLGAICYSILFARMPCKNVPDFAIKSQHNVNIDNQLIDFISSLLHIDYRKRINLSDAINHPFLN